jgi:hypothetical protein
MAIWYNLCSFGTFFRFWYHVLKKSGNPETGIVKLKCAARVTRLGEFRHLGICLLCASKNAYTTRPNLGASYFSPQEKNKRIKFDRIRIGLHSGTDVMITIFCDFQTVFGEKFGVFHRNQYYDQIFA